MLTQHSGHHDLSLVVFWGKQIEHILRKHFCKKLPHGKSIMLGRLISQYSNFKKRDRQLMFQLQALVKKRNMLVHELNEKKFPNQQSRAEYIANCNIAMKSLKIYSQQPEQVDQVNWPESFTQPDLPLPTFHTSSNTRGGLYPELTYKELCRYELYLIEWVGWIFLLLILWILTLCLNWLLINPVWLVLRLKDRLTPSHSCSILPLELEQQMKYHSWRMIKLDPHLQRAIVEDADGYFRGLFPQSMDEYLSKYSRVIHVPHQIMSMHSNRLVHFVFAISLLYFTLGIIPIFFNKK